jgi:hypothetical protein
MAESTLSLSRSDLLAEVGYRIGYGRASTGWSAGQLENLEAGLKAGHRLFYTAHNWSFIEPTGAITTVSGQGDYNLPDSFAYLIGSLTFAPTSAYRAIRTTGENEIRALRTQNNGNGIPQVAAVRFKGSDGSTGQRQELMLWPAPAGEHVLTYRYAVLPDALADEKPWPLGGMGHAETILAACWAATELIVDGQKGAGWEAYQERLANSIRLDARNKPSSLGMMLDGDVDYGRTQPIPTLTYNGVEL